MRHELCHHEHGNVTYNAFRVLGKTFGTHDIRDGFQCQIRRIIAGGDDCWFNEVQLLKQTPRVATTDML
jgi:hypothetical protein